MISQISTRSGNSDRAAAAISEAGSFRFAIFLQKNAAHLQSSKVLFVNIRCSFWFCFCDRIIFLILSLVVKPVWRLSQQCKPFPLSTTHPICDRCPWAGMQNCIELYFSRCSSPEWKTETIWSGAKQSTIAGKHIQGDTKPLLTTNGVDLVDQQSRHEWSPKWM